MTEQTGVVVYLEDVKENVDFINQQSKKVRAIHYQRGKNKWFDLWQEIKVWDSSHSFCLISYYSKK